MENELQVTLDNILEDKNTNLKPENLKAGVTCLGVDGTLEEANYDNTLTPTEYNESNKTLDEILDGYKPVSISQMNLFIQTSEPENKNGIWVETDNNFENQITIQNILIDSGEYKQKHIIPVGLLYSSVVNIGSDIYVLGSNNSDINYKYNTLTDTYTQLTNIPYEFYRGSATAIGTDIYLLGGTGASTYNYKYDTLTDTYTQLADIPYSFIGGSVVSVGTNIYLLGGSSSYRKNYKYDTLTDTYTQLTNIPYDSYSGKAVAIGTDIYLLGNTSDRGNFYNNYKYNTLTGIYTQLTNIPFIFSEGSTINIGTDIYLFGSSNSASSRYAYKYDTLTDTYTQLTNIPYDFSYGSVVSIGNSIYLLGGKSSGTNNYEFTLTLQNNIPNNSLVLEQGGTIYRTILFDSDFTNGIEYKFSNIWLKNADGTIDNTTKVYYGDGAKWVQFKGEVDS